MVTDVKPRDLGILTVASCAIEETRHDGFLTIETDVDIRIDEACVHHMLRDLMDAREGTLWLQITKQRRI